MTALLVAVVTAAAVLVALAPGGWLARSAYRVGRPAPLARSARPGSSPVPAPSHRRGAQVGLRAVGRRARGAVGRAPDDTADAQVGAVAVVALVVAVTVTPWLGPVAVAGGWGWVRWRARTARAGRERAVRTALPDAVDLFRLAAGSGLSVHQAVEAVVARAPSPVDAALGEVRRRVALGERLGDALDELDRLGDPVVPLAAALRGAARYGTPLGPSLERAAADARVLRRRRAEEDARRLPVHLLFPLVMCVLPAFGLLAVVPLLLASLGSLSL